MNKPKYLQALDLREQGLSYEEIASRLETKPRRVREYLNKARHLEHKLLLHRAHCRRYYYRDLEKSRRKSREYWRRDPERWQREKLVTVINGYETVKSKIEAEFCPTPGEDAWGRR